MCKNFLRGRACFKGNRCPYSHPPHAQAHIAITDTGLPGTDSDQHNYEHATRFDELDFQLGPNKMWWLVPRSMYPLSIITYLTFNPTWSLITPCSDQPPQQRHHILRCRHVGFRMYDLHHSHFSLTRRCKKTHVQIQHPSLGNRREHLYSGQAHLRHYLGWRYFPRFLQHRHTDHDIRHSHLDQSEHTRPPHTVILYYRWPESYCRTCAYTPIWQAKTYCSALYNLPPKDKTDPQPFTRRPNHFQWGTTGWLSTKNSIGLSKP